MNYKDFNLGDWIEHINGAIEDERELDRNEMRDLVEFLSKMPRWIPVSERLPEDGGPYLVSVKNDRSIRYSKTCWFSELQSWLARQKVIAWMPLPEPWKGESE